MDLCELQPVLLSNGVSQPLALVQFTPAWEAQAYLRFAGLPYRVENTRYVDAAASGPYPQLVDGQFIVPSSGITSHLAARHRNLDEDLLPKEKAEAAAFLALVREQLRPVLSAFRHGVADEIGYRQTVLPPLRKTLLWPLRWVVPRMLYWGAELEGLVRNTLWHTKEDMVTLARSALQVLDDRLGEEADFFFGKRPCALDACVFGHLADAMTEVHLVGVLPNYHNLMSFFKRVCARYFSPADFSFCHQGAEGEKAALLEAAMRRANCVNEENVFNHDRQLQRAFVCAGAPPAPDPFPPQRPLVAAVPVGKPAEQPPGFAGASGEPDSSEHPDFTKGNFAWIAVTVASMVGFLAYRSGGIGVMSEVVLEDGEPQE